MARQDFAKIEASSKGDSQGTSIMPVVAILFVAGLCFAAGYWLGAGDVAQTGNKTDVDAVEAKLAVKDAEAKVLQAKIESLQEQVEQWRQKSEQGAHTKVGELSFYRELPKQSVTPEPVSATAEAKAAAAARAAAKAKAAASAQAEKQRVTEMPTAEPAKPAAGAFRIQLASFKSRSDAMVMQQKISQAGFSAVIRMADLGEKGQWYRLYVGPFESRAAAEQAVADIEKQMKLKGFIVRGG